jgi:hypothetical protein
MTLLKKRWNLFAALCVLMTVGFSATPALSAPDQFICAAGEAVSCVQDEVCVRGSAEMVSLPLLWRVNLAEMAFVSVSEGGIERRSAILDMVEGESALALFGVDGTMAWSTVIDTNDGTMTLTASTNDTGFIVHGMCSTKILN